MRAHQRGLVLPTSWEKGAGSRGNSRHLDIKETRIKYTGPGSADKDAASVRANAFVPTSLPIYYFEVEVISKGREGYIGVGFCTKDVNMDRLPGWEPQSYGYHGDDGNAFRSDGKGRKYGPQFGKGDFIGACLNRVDKTISYFKNGIDLGVAFHNVLEEQLFPCIGMQTHEEEVVANFNFGDSMARFSADVDDMKKAAAGRMESDIMRMALPNQGRVGSLMGELLFGYMVHNGYWETAAAVARDMLEGTVQVQPKDIQEVKLRNTIADDVVAGNITEAIHLADTLAPGMLSANPSLQFRLHLQTFFDLVRAKDDNGAMHFARNILVRAVKTDMDYQELQDALSLMGYDDPTTSPCGQMMSQHTKDELAHAIMTAIRKHLGRQQHSALEKAILQLMGVLTALEERGSPEVGLLEHTKNPTCQAWGEIRSSRSAAQL